MWTAGYGGSVMASGLLGGGGSIRGIYSYGFSTGTVRPLTVGLINTAVSARTRSSVWHCSRVYWGKQIPPPLSLAVTSRRQRHEWVDGIWFTSLTVLLRKLTFRAVTFLYSRRSITGFFTYMPDCWLEVSIRKVVRPATSTQGFLGFPVPKSKC